MEHLNLVQKAALTLIQQDLRYIYTVIKNIQPTESNYIPSMIPYLGVIIDGAEDWIKSFNNSNRYKIDFPLFEEHERLFYEQIRTSIKMWQQNYEQIYDSLGTAFQISDEYFGSICKPIAKTLKLYDIYGVDTINGVMCGNTILHIANLFMDYRYFFEHESVGYSNFSTDFVHIVCDYALSMKEDLSNRIDEIDWTSRSIKFYF